MKIESDDLKKSFQRYVSSKFPDSRNTCPSPMALFDSFKSSTSLRHKKYIIDHITDCSFCREEFGLILELNKYQISATSIIKINEISSPAYTTDKQLTTNIGRHFIWRYASFLIGLILILSAYFLIVKQISFLEVMRTAEQRIILISPAHMHIFPKPLIFRWQKQASSQYYILELFDNSLLPVWTSHKIADLQIQLPEEFLSHLHSRNYYFWMITAFSGTQKISESELRRLLVLKK